MAHLITRFISWSTYDVCTENPGPVFYIRSCTDNPGPVKTHGCLMLELGLARYLWGFCENETSRETNLARRDFSRD